METGNDDEVKRKRTSVTRLTTGGKKIKITVSSLTNQSLQSSEVVIKCNSRDAEKEPSPVSKTRSAEANQADDRAVSSKTRSAEANQADDRATGSQGDAVVAAESETHVHVSDHGRCVEQPEASTSYGAEASDKLEALEAEMRKEVHRLSDELKERAEMCMKLDDENQVIMDYLKQFCCPYLIQSLEDQNPNCLPNCESPKKAS